MGVREMVGRAKLGEATQAGWSGKLDDGVIIHSALIAVMTWLAVILILPGDTFRSAATFDVMARLADENTWAMAFWVAATVGAMGLTTASRGLRMTSVLVLATMHGVVSLCFVLANPLTTGTGTYAIIALLGYHLAWRRAHEGG